MRGAARRRSPRSAAVFWGLLPPRRGPVDLLVAGSSRAERAGIRAHRTSHLPATDVWTRKGLERRFLALTRRAGLPEPETNAEIDVLRFTDRQLDAAPEKVLLTLGRSWHVRVPVDG